MGEGNMRANDETAKRELRIASGAAVIEGMLELPAHPGGIVVFAHGSGSSRFSPRNNFVAAELRRAGLGTLLLDLLTPEEDAVRARRFDEPGTLERVAALAAAWFSRHLAAAKP